VEVSAAVLDVVDVVSKKRNVQKQKYFFPSIFRLKTQKHQKLQK
jgi:hypothetical protein